MRDAVIVSGARTAVGEFGGALKGVSVVELGKVVMKEALKRAGLRPAVSDFIKSCRPDCFGDFDMTDIQKKYYDYDSSLKPVYIDEVIMGNVLNAGVGQNPARQSAIFAVCPRNRTSLPSRKSAPPA